ncbi:hydroxyacid dehydrogenase [bacterium]|nr:MAG: hydroxyacid dehydrogenase [bacterium]
MTILISSASARDREVFESLLTGHELRFSSAPVDRLAAEKLLGVDALAVVHGHPVSEETIVQIPRLRLIVTRSTGFDHIDLAASEARGIAVCNVPEYGSTTVAEFTMGLILSLARNIHRAYVGSSEGHFSVEGLMGTDLEGKTLGIVGLGRIGRKVAQMARGFDMRVVAYDPIAEDSIPFGEVLRTSDFLALCCPLTTATHHLINRETLAQMKPGAFLVNTARGGVVDSDALWEALESGIIAGAGLDVLEGEEAIDTRWDESHLRRNLALMGHPRVLVTPHLAFDSKEALDRIRATTADVLNAFARGEILHRVA